MYTKIGNIRCAVEGRSASAPIFHFSFFTLKAAPFSGQGTGETVNVSTDIYNGAATKLSSGSIGGYTQSNTAVSSVTDAIKTPNTYYYLNSGGWQWLSVDISLWSDYGTNKSIYDPCPYGYRVPNNGSWNSWGSSHSQAWTAYMIDGGIVMSSTWWPASGYRAYDSGALGYVGNLSYYWSSSRHSNAYCSYNLGFNYSGGVYPSVYYGRSYGFSVRCVQERGRFAWDLGRGSVGALFFAGIPRLRSG